MEGMHEAPGLRLASGVSLWFACQAIRFPQLRSPRQGPPWRERASIKTPHHQGIPVSRGGYPPPHDVRGRIAVRGRAPDFVLGSDSQRPTTHRLPRCPKLGKAPGLRVPRPFELPDRQRRDNDSSTGATAAHNQPQNDSANAISGSPGFK